MSKKSTNELDALREILQNGLADSQEDIVNQLQNRGIDANQSKISRLLHRIGATKRKNEQGQIVYCLPKEPAPPSTQSSLAYLVLDITANETMVVVTTSPGAASLIARLIDYRQDHSQILATIAGDDAILVIPKSINDTQQVLAEVKQLLAEK